MVSPSKMKIGKKISQQLFKKAHEANNGETFLKEILQKGDSHVRNSRLIINKSKKSEKSWKIVLAHLGKQGSQLQIQKVIDININNEDDELSQVIFGKAHSDRNHVYQLLEIEEINMLGSESIPMLKKNSSIKDETIA